MVWAESGRTLAALGMAAEACYVAQAGGPTMSLLKAVSVPLMVPSTPYDAAAATHTQKQPLARAGAVWHAGSCGSSVGQEMTSEKVCPLFGLGGTV